MKHVSYVLGIALSLFILIILEAICTMGMCFNFSEYNWFAWVFQALLVVITICCGVLATHEELNPKKSSK